MRKGSQSRYAHRCGPDRGRDLVRPGVTWTLWRLQQRSIALAVNPAQLYETARQQRDQRAAWHQHAVLQRLSGMPEWRGAQPRALRTDILGSTPTGLRSLLTVHVAALLAQQLQLVADVSGQDAAA